MERIVDIATDHQHLSAYRGFLKVERNREEIGRVPLDDIAAVIVHAHGITYSNNLLVALAERNALLISCGPNHSPVSCVWPLEGHHLQGARMRAQWDAGKPLRKRLWQQIVTAKIEMQAAVLDSLGRKSGGVRALARTTLLAFAARPRLPARPGIGRPERPPELRLYHSQGCDGAGGSGKWPSSHDCSASRKPRQRPCPGRRPDGALSPLD